MTVINEKLDEICGSLQGTCLNSLEQECENHGIDIDDLTYDDHLYIDEQIFNCTGCGWWCESSEANESDDGDICDDCNREREEE